MASSEEVSLARVPLLEASQMRFELQQQLDSSTVERTQCKLLKLVESKSMAPFYVALCEELKWSMDKTLLQRMEAENKKELEALEAKILDAEKNEGDSELRDALTQKAEYLAKIGDMKQCIEVIELAMTKTIGWGHKLDLVFLHLRVGLFQLDHKLISDQMVKAKEMIEVGGDWDRRNRLKVYEALYAMAVRDFTKAADLFLETVATFTSYELMDFSQLVDYAVHMAMLALERRQLHDKVIKGAEILEALHSNEETRSFLFAFYECRYSDFFQCLASVEQKLKADRYLHPHYAYYVREMKTKAIAQLLQSYRSLSLSYMAEAFNVTEEYMDRELSRLIADNRLHARIDKVRGIVVTNRPDSKNAQYQAVIKQGDVLLNRVQKLSRVINM